MDSPTTIGPYRVLRELGRGGMGAVFEAEKDGQLFALKQLTNSNPESWLRFRREAEILASVDQHPHILRIHGFGESPSGPYFVMELVAGASLSDWLRRHGPLPPHKALELLAKIADALAFLHERGIIHRDLKAANILLSEDGEPKLSDFGIASAQDAEKLTLTGLAMGTPYAMAPEQVAGQALTAAADIWALGVLLFETLTARVPFEGAGSQLARAICQEPWPTIPGLSPEIHKLLDLLLNKQLTARPTARRVAQICRGQASATSTEKPRPKPLLYAIFALGIIASTITIYLISKPTPTISNLEMDAIIERTGIASEILTLHALQQALEPDQDSIISPEALSNARRIDTATEEWRARLNDQQRRRLDTSIALEARWQPLRILRELSSPRPWRRELSPLEKILELSSDKQWNNAIALLQQLTLPQRALSLCKAFILIRAARFHEAAAILDELRLSQNTPNWLRLDSIRAHVLDGQAFEPISDPNHLQDVWRELLSHPDATSRAAQWNARTEARLHELQGQEAINFALAWRALSLSSPLIAAPLAPRPIHKLLSEQSPPPLGAHPIIYPSVHRLLASENIESAIPELLKILLNIESIAPPGTRLSFHQAAELLDLIVLMARRGRLFLTLRLPEIFEMKELVNGRLESSPNPTSSAIHQLLASYVRLWTASPQSTADVRNSLAPLFKHLTEIESAFIQYDAPSLQSHALALQINILAHAIPALSDPSQLPEVFELGSHQQAQDWLAQRLQKILTLHHDVPDFVITNSLSISTLSLQKSMNSEQKREALLWAEKATSDALDWLAYRHRIAFQKSSSQNSAASQRSFKGIVVPLDSIENLRAIAIPLLITATSITARLREPERARQRADWLKSFGDTPLSRDRHWGPVLEKMQSILDPDTSNSQRRALATQILKFTTTTAETSADLLLRQSIREFVDWDASRP